MDAKLILVCAEMLGIAAAPTTGISPGRQLPGEACARTSECCALATPCMASGQGISVKVGFRGSIWSCLEQSSWAPRNSGTLSSLYAIAYGKDRFVAVGNEGALVTSTDGSVWSIGDS